MPDHVAVDVFRRLIQRLEQRQGDLGVLQKEITDLRQQGYGSHHAYPLLAQCAQVPDPEVAPVIVKSRNFFFAAMRSAVCVLV